jgi:hypothetical protein
MQTTMNSAINLRKPEIHSAFAHLLLRLFRPGVLRPIFAERLARLHPHQSSRQARYLPRRVASGP